MTKYPVTFVIFGATGDLAEKKLFPALFGLYSKKLLPRHVKIVAFARRPFTDETFRELVSPYLEGPAEKIQEFLSKITYHQGLFDDIKAYISLITRLGDIDKELGACSHKIFHLSVAPSFYETVLHNLEKSALNLSCTDGTGETRLLIEKPIGTNLASARLINSLLGAVFNENQIFRVDHYLAKSALLDFLTMRFWHNVQGENEHIERITFNLFEKVTAEGRGVFYDSIGALRDVGQNHLLQMLALTTMSGQAKDPRRARASSLEAVTLAPDVTSSINPKFIRGQYEGYLAEEGVAKDSETKTFFSVPLFINNTAWKGVHFVLQGGKAFVENEVSVKVYFKTPTELVIGSKKYTGALQLSFYIQPNPRIEVVLSGGEVVTVSHGELFSKPATDNYEKIYHDALLNDQSNFVSKEEIEASWVYVDSVRARLIKEPLIRYPKGQNPDTIF